MHFLEKLREKLSTRLYTPVEEDLLAALKAELSPEAAALLAGQLEQVSKVQRLYSPTSVEINLYPIKGKKVVRDPTLKFPAEGEIKLGTIVFKKPDTSEPTWKADLYAVNGWLFSIVIRPNPKPVQAFHVEVVSVETVADPMEPSLKVEVKKLGHAPHLEGWLDDWLEEHEATDFSPPLPEQLYTHFLSKVDAKLPDDYPEIVSQLEGLIVENVSILGLSEIYLVHLPDADFYFLAEIHGEGMLGVKEGSQDQKLYFRSYEGDKQEELGTSFRRAVESYLDSSKDIVR
jgi:hypothetical protein